MAAIPQLLMIIWYESDDAGSVDANMNKCTFSEDEARQMADDFLAKVGCTDASLKKYISALLGLL